MKFKKYSELEGQHAFLSASQYHWLRYTPEQLTYRYKTALAKEQGTKLHEFASNCISMGIKLEPCEKTLNLFVNDAIDAGMSSEVLLYYSPYCFGTTDAIAYEDNILSISDLKTGVTKASFNQLKIYAALFCLDYRIDPHDLTAIILKIYQFDSVSTCEADPEEIQGIMNTMIFFTGVLSEMEEG